MGIYINPPRQRQETWVKENGIRSSFTQINARTYEEIMRNQLIPVVLIDNSLFFAALVCFDKCEYHSVENTFVIESDPRPFEVFLVAHDKLDFVPGLRQHLEAFKPHQ